MRRRFNVATRLTALVAFAAIFAAIGLFSLIGSTTEAFGEDKPSVESILSRYVEAIGGREVIEKLSTRACFGKRVTDFTSRQQPIYESLYFEAYGKVPSSWYIETWSDAGIHRTGFDGKIGWVKDNCGVRVDENAVRTQLAYFLNPQGPLQIEAYFPELNYEGKQNINGREAYALKPSSLQPEYYTLYFGVETGLLVGIGYYWLIEDYRKVDGVLFPHRINTSRKGGSTVYELERVTHNREINDSLFMMPGNPR